MAEGDVSGMFGSDMDPQDLPMETATFRGTWETHEGKEMMSEDLRQRLFSFPFQLERKEPFLPDKRQMKVLKIK